MGDNLEGQGSQISRQELFEIWCDTVKNNRTNPLFEFVLDKLNIDTSDKVLLRKIHHSLPRFSSHIESNWRSAGKNKDRFQVKYRDWLDGYLRISTCTEDKENFDPKHDQEATKTGRPEKSFDDCGDQSKRTKVRHLVENVSVSELTYAAQMATRASASRSTADLTKRVLGSPEVAKTYITSKEKYSNQQHYSPEDALAFYIDNNCTQRTYKSTRKGALARGHALYPSYYSIKNVKKQL